jgi:putative Holliday junction resolvase
MAKMKHKPATLLGFDFGMKSIGVAVGQTITKSAKPLTTLKAKNGMPNWSLLAQLIGEWRPDALVVGIPYNMNGTDQPITQAAKEFAQNLQRRFSLPIHLVDERLTTVEARARLFGEKGYRGMQKAAVDAKAAQLILESWMAQQDEEDRNV